MTMHQGSCHCGKVNYEAKVDLNKPVISCNCSMCAKKGTLLTFISEADFKLVGGKDDLSNYQFNKKAIHHLFCKHCGVTSFAKGESPKGDKMIAINVRCLSDVDLDKLQVHKVDGKSF